MQLTIKDKTLFKKSPNVENPATIPVELPPPVEQPPPAPDHSAIINTLVNRVLELSASVDQLRTTPDAKREVVATIQRDKDGKMTHIIINEQ